MRPFHIIERLSADHEIDLVSLSKEPGDIVYAADLEKFCDEVKIIALNLWINRFYAACCLLLGLPLTFGFFYSRGFRSAVAQKLESNSYDIILSFCSSTAFYFVSDQLKLPAKPYSVVDFIDIDSVKWGEYAKMARGSLIERIKGVIFRREHRLLGAWEQRITDTFDQVILTTSVEKDRLETMNPVLAGKIRVLQQGIDLDYFSRSQVEFDDSQTLNATPTIVFTGQMDYLPNIDGVVYFYHNILPLIREKIPTATFQIVGRNASPELAQVCKTAVITGEVPDIRSYVAAATVFVAPLRLAFGVQNKVLEAMALSIPVVCTSRVAQGLSAEVGRDFLVADEPELFAEAVLQLISGRKQAAELASNGLRYVQKEHNWARNVASFESQLPTNFVREKR